MYVKAQRNRRFGKAIKRNRVRLCTISAISAITRYMHAWIILISHLHVADGDAVVDAVPHHLVLHLLPPAKGLFHQNLVGQRQRLAPQFPTAVDQIRNRSQQYRRSAISEISNIADQQQIYRRNKRRSALVDQSINFKHRHF